MGIIYLSTKYELDRSANNGDLLVDMILWKHTQTHTQTHTETESDTLPIWDIRSSNELCMTGAQKGPLYKLLWPDIMWIVY